ncbi:uncharacterized protein DUF3298 [Hydrogenoanaerobacterium saccharovorans]|uniref:DUF3298 domain-containing protein n=1 Tax=Hydrogenoanaerobacterium saccharovorans TaxID=474960 RepID=A0A1H7YR43_9FIRM|nr:DUF3298 and DUF4163 domain-containing protein [Hydrogenoanaerobacterium saccharovorans]RPF49105.1 uncharacterized protein DUF3298 [Hydrogenoanaerobacterium saccharovorans]SEM47767.1 Protein of unknown function [Hydrogenoanaerobacterium saccharovorans]
MFYDSVLIKSITIQRKMYYKENLLLSYKIEYPQFVSAKFQSAVIRMNVHYKRKALEFQKYCENKLFKMAVEQYEYSVENGFPVRAFEAILNYTVTYNHDCTVSMYFQQYEYTGGAHGNTIQYSDTWNLQDARRMKLWQFFSRSVNYRHYILTQINLQIAKQIANGENIYFDNYEQNVANYFNQESFYLTPKGVVVYFQQYEIAPYASGIPEFTIPYLKGVVLRPRCH